MQWVIGGALAALLVGAVLELMVSVLSLRQTVYGSLPFVVMLAVFVCGCLMGALSERQKEIEKLKKKKH